MSNRIPTRNLAAGKGDAIRRGTNYRAYWKNFDDIFRKKKDFPVPVLAEPLETRTAAEAGHGNSTSNVNSTNGEAREGTLEAANGETPADSRGGEKDL